MGANSRYFRDKNSKDRRVGYWYLRVEVGGLQRKSDRKRIPRAWLRQLIQQLTVSLTDTEAAHFVARN